MPKVVKLLLLAGVLVAAGFYISSRREEIPAKLTGVSNIANIIAPNPTPFEFSDMTIPHLRTREYNSELGELNRHSNSGSFTSYLTSYTSDGLKINGLLTIPNNGNQRHPAIVFVHGYIAPTIYRTTERYADYVNYLARNGYVVFKIDLRGHGSSEGEPGGSYYSGDYIVDTLNAYSALKNADFVDPNKIGLWGHSMAGNVTFRSLVAQQNIPAVAIWGGAGFTYEDLVNYRISDMSYRPPQQNTQRQRNRQKLRDLYGEFNKDHEFWKQVTPINYLDGVSGAVGLFHAVNDDVVSVEYSRNLDKVLDGTGINHEFHEYSGGGHNITNPYFTPAMADTAAFFDKYLKNN